MLADRCSFHIRHDLNGVRIAHRNNADLERFVRHVEVIDHHIVVVQEGNFCRGKARFAHVHRSIAVGFQARRDDAALRLDTNFALVGQPLLVNETYEAARAIAALLNLTTVGIEDAVTEIDT